MKKLMIAAAAAAMVGGAFADACSPEETSTDCAAVYKFTMSIKTTKGVIGSETSITSICEPSVTACTVIRVKDSTKFEGWIYECACGCETIKSGSVVAWDSKRKTQLGGPTFDWTILNVMGKKQSDAEAMWTFNSGDVAYDTARTQGAYELTGAGYGKFSASKGLYTSFSGNFAGKAGASFDLSIKKYSEVTCICEPSQIWACTDLTTLADSDTIAYGTWSVKYDSSTSKKFLDKGTSSLKVPSYVTIAE